MLYCLKMHTGQVCITDLALYACSPMGSLCHMQPRQQKDCILQSCSNASEVEEGPSQRRSMIPYALRSSLGGNVGATYVKHVRQQIQMALHNAVSLGRYGFLYVILVVLHADVQASR